MRSFRFALSISVLLLSPASCGLQGGPAPIEMAALQTGPTLRTLNMFDTLRLSNDVSMTFNRVSDERCPLDVVCASAGEATAGFLVEQEGKPDFSVSIPWDAVTKHDPALRYTRVANYRIYLMSLLPHPPSDEPSPAKAYKAELKIELDRQ